MGKKKDKSKKGKGAEKTALKTEKNAEKKVKKMLKAKGEENIEALITECQEQGKKQLHVVEERCEQPSPRSNSTLTPHPDKEELILFGGEFFNGNKTVMYNDMFVYSVKNNAWTVLKVPGAPPPRSAHQTVAVKQAGGQLWMFGGEFASPSQSQFYHYKDLWVFHFHSNKWEKVSVAGGPSARSGHRMVVCKKQIFVFGGFHDNSRGDYKYFNDVFVFDLSTYSWTQFQPSGILPPPRSGCCMAVNQDEKSIVMFGGYSKKSLKKDVDKGTIHTDMYVLSLDGESGDKKDVKWKWTHVKQCGARPSPRCSCAVVGTPGNRALFFGGVVDDEEDEDMDSRFYNDMYMVELDKGRWHQVELRDKKEIQDKKKRRRKKEDTIETGSGDEQCDTDDDIEDDVERLTMMENSTASVENSKTLSSNVCDTHPSSSQENDSTFTVSIGPQTGQTHSNKTGASTTLHPGEQFWPCPRMNAQLAVRNGILYMYGGMYEEGEKQLTLQDMYCLDLHKLAEWKTLIKNEKDQLVWEASDSSDSEDSDDDEDEGMDTDDPPPLNKDETLNDYFSKSKDFWLDKAEELAETEGLSVTMKQLKKAAFKMADEHVQEHSGKL